MHKLLTTTILVMASSSGAVANNGETATILEIHAAFATNWNKHDHRAMAAMYADDADLITPLGRTARGKAEIEKLYLDEHSTVFKSSTFASSCKGGVRLLKPDVAVVTCSFEVTGGVLPDGKPMPALSGIYTATMVKAKTKWRVVAGRPMIPFLPPGAPPSKS